MLKPSAAFMATLLILGPLTGCPILGRLPVLGEPWPGESPRMHISRKNLRTNELILRGKNELPKNILKNGKLEGYDLKMAWLNNLFNVGKKSQLKEMEQLQLYFENSHKYIETRLPLAYTTLETNILKVEPDFKKSQEILEAILMLRIVKQKIPRRQKPIEIIILQKKIYKNNIDSVLSSVKEKKFSKESTTIYNKNQHRIFSDEALNKEQKDGPMGFKKYGQLSKDSQQKSSFLSTENMKVQKRKTTKTSATENQKFPFTYVFPYQRGNNSILKIFSTYDTVLSNTGEKKQFALNRKLFRNQNLIKQASVLKAKKSKYGKNDLDASSKIYYIEFSVINLALPSITSTIGVKCDLLSSQVYTCKAKSSVYMVEMLKHLMIASRRVKKKHFNIAQKGFKISVLKREMARKHHDTEQSLPALLYLHKHALKGPSIIQRTKRSTEKKIKEETVTMTVSVIGVTERVPQDSSGTYQSYSSTTMDWARGVHLPQEEEDLRLHPACLQPEEEQRLSSQEPSLHLQESDNLSYLKRLTSALIAGATLFGLALSALALAACYLYYNRRNLGQFINGLKGEEFQNRAKSTDASSCMPFSLSQNFHFQQPQESSKTRTPVATVTEQFSKAGSDMVTVKEIYRNTDTEGSLNAYKGFSIRSRAFVSHSRSSGSIGSVFDDAPNVSSAQLSSRDEISKENEFSVLSNSNLKEKASVSAAYLPRHRSYDYQKHGVSYDVLKKPRITRSKSENDIVIASSSREVRPVHSVSMLH